MSVPRDERFVARSRQGQHVLDCAQDERGRGMPERRVLTFVEAMHAAASMLDSESPTTSERLRRGVDYLLTVTARAEDFGAAEAGQWFWCRACERHHAVPPGEESYRCPMCGCEEVSDTDGPEVVQWKVRLGWPEGPRLPADALYPLPAPSDPGPNEKAER